MWNDADGVVIDAEGGAEALERLLADEVPLVPLFDQPLTYLLAPSLSWTPRADTFILVNEIAVDAAAAP